MPQFARHEPNACIFCCSLMSSILPTRRPRGPYHTTYQKSDLVLALTDYRSAIRSGHPITFAQAGAAYHIPASTVRDANKKANAAIARADRHTIPHEILKAAVTTSLAGSHKRLLTDEVEQKLCDYIELCKRMTLPIDIDVVKHKAKRLYYATHNIPITDENRDEMASKRWWQAFRKRHPTLTLRSPQQLAVQRAKATQPEIINHFYDLLELAYDTYGFQSQQIWAMDETGVDNNFKVRKVVANKGMYMHAQYQVSCMSRYVTSCMDMSYFIYFCLGDGRVPLLTSKLTSHMSILHMCNANGLSLPPMYVFSGKHLVNNMLEGAPDGTFHHNT